MSRTPQQLSDITTTLNTAMIRKLRQVVRTHHLTPAEALTVLTASCGGMIVAMCKENPLLADQITSSIQEMMKNEHQH